MNRDKFNADRLVRYTKRMIAMAYLLVAIMAGANLYLVYKLIEEKRRETTYLVDEKGSISLRREEIGTTHRHAWEYENFLESLARTLTEHQPENYEKHIAMCNALMGQEAFLTLKNQYIASGMEEIFKEYKAYSTMKPEAVAIHKDHTEGTLIFRLTIDFPHTPHMKPVIQLYALTVHFGRVKRSAANPYGLVATHAQLQETAPKNQEPQKK